MPSATRREIRLDRALPPQHWDGIEHKDTIYMCVVDRDGNAVSFINSLFSSFGTGIMAPESGVILHNRGSGFRLDPRPSERDRAAQAPVPHADPRHAGQGRPRGDAVRRDGRAVPGGRPRDLSALPARSRHGPAAGRRGAARLRLSGRVADRAFRARAGRAPTSRSAATSIEMLDVPIGGCQAIWIDRERGVLIGGSEPRKDGLALGY